VLGLAALILAAATANAPTGLSSASPWWEKFTYTMTEDGTQQSCQYKSSVSYLSSQGCDDGDGSEPMIHATSGSTGTLTKITIERRFTPGTAPNPVALETGDTLLGGQIMAIAIDSAGVVSSCEIVGASGKLKPPYGCDEVRTERFEADANSPDGREGVITVLVYGHEEYPV